MKDSKKMYFITGTLLTIGLFLVLLLFSRQPYDSNKGIRWSFKNIGQPEHDDTLKILSINSHDGKIKMEYSTNFPPGMGSLYLYVDFVYDEWDLDHSESGFYWGGKVIKLIEKKEKAHETYRDQHIRNRYKAEFEIEMPINQKRFPFDTIGMEFWVYRDLQKSVSLRADRNIPTPFSFNHDIFIKTPRSLEVYNYIDGYVLQQGLKRVAEYPDSIFPDAEVVQFSLKRDPFIRIMTIAFFILGLAISFYIIFSWQPENLKDLSLLSYFVALWGIRNILLSPIPNPKPFPTLIDTFVLYLVFATFILFGILRQRTLRNLLERLKQKSDNNDE